MHRIPSRNTIITSKQPVLIIHGLSASSFFAVLQDGALGNAFIIFCNGLSQWTGNRDKLPQIW